VSNRLHISDLPSTLDVMDTLRRFEGEKFLLLLDSAAHVRERDARFTILTADPVESVRLDDVHLDVDPFAVLRHWQTLVPDVPDFAPPFCGGIAGLLSYELGQAFERLPTPEFDPFSTPALVAGLFDWAIVWDHVDRSVRMFVIDLGSGVAGEFTRSTQARIDWVLARLQGDIGRLSHVKVAEPALAELLPAGHKVPSEENVVSCFSRDDYITAVERVIEYIRAGDIFQANLAQQMTAFWPGTAVSLYQRVRDLNPAPFCALLQLDDFSIVSASPERFLKVGKGNIVETRPIKGTRRRQRSPIADLYTSNELSASEKDRAENVMIVDLLRNDLSRVCLPGSVKVTGLCEIEVFETVQHLVSTVVGKLSHDKDIWDLCAATIPGGSITGAPKIRAMQIIAELEPVVRGAYCGNLFYLGPRGDFDSSILIRTFTLKNGVVQFPVGGGIVADSSPADEYQETLHKAAGMIRAMNSNKPKPPPAAKAAY